MDEAMSVPQSQKLLARLDIGKRDNRPTEAFLRAREGRFIP